MVCLFHVGAGEFVQGFFATDAQMIASLPVSLAYWDEWAFSGGVCIEGLNCFPLRNADVRGKDLVGWSFEIYRLRELSTDNDHHYFSADVQRDCSPNAYADLDPQQRLHIGDELLHYSIGFVRTNDWVSKSHIQKKVLAWRAPFST